MRLFHGTSLECAEAMAERGLRPGSYATTDFELAASYALRRSRPAVVIVDAPAREPGEEEIAYEGGVEWIITEVARPLAILVPRFRDAPPDWFELDERLNRKYPRLFQRNSWKEIVR